MNGLAFEDYSPLLNYEPIIEYLTTDSAIRQSDGSRAARMLQPA